MDNLIINLLNPIIPSPQYTLGFCIFDWCSRWMGGTGNYERMGDTTKKAHRDLAFTVNKVQKLHC